ncbi:DUF4173 domain-containing protein [Paenibacillus filicis]|uniref:DUF4173 domain-containing protein n=1 Tax=Paenibacillus gyeongsangnamensis TaxID=3388067 RepID=A0ABT4QFM9_9BACL|nr:DUF4173 domain-containing protein [Paenibacillus filicis]MCZ8515688.1 DUF4173 domain-containing protein [Paenibacillus filicis]
MSATSILKEPAYSARNASLLLAAAAVATVNQFIFYGMNWGIQYPLFVLVLYGFYYWAMGDKVRLRLEPSASLLLPILLLSLSFAVHANLLFLILNAIVVPSLIAVHMFWASRSVEQSRLDGRFAVRLLENVLIQTLCYIPEPFRMMMRGAADRLKSGRSKELGKVLLGLLISVPVLAVVLTLLSSADSIFGHTLARLPEWFHFSWEPVLFRIIWVAALSVFLFAYIAGLRSPMRLYSGRENPPFAADESDTEPSAVILPQPSAIGRLDPTIAATVLIVLNSVYLLFAAVQFSYFFGGGSKVLHDGITYASYARQGFAELVIVTLINLTVLIAAVYGLDRSRTGPGGLWLGRILLTLLIACTGVMLSSAYLRLSMYEEAYGYTMTRLLVHSFMPFLLVLLLLALWKAWSDRAAFIRCSLAAGIIAYVVLNYVPIEGMIVKGNVARYAATGQFDAGYLTGLSYEVVPDLVELSRTQPELPGIGAALDTFRSRLGGTSGTSWLEWNAAEWKAKKVLGP